MKKNLVALLLVLAVVSVGVFAAPTNPDPASFNVTTTVTGINLMKITKAQYNPSNPNPTNFGSAEAYGGTHSVSAGGTQVINAWISTLSNSRKGYKVTMGATAMKSSLEGASDTYINYTVKVDNNNDKKITTNNATLVTPVTVIQHDSLQGPTATSLQISLEVNEGEFNTAVEGVYTGTVTFTYSAN
jgi:hypothetical protein